MRRILYSFPVLIGITLICFLIFGVVGGDPALEMAGRHATEAQLLSIRHELGLDQPLYVQYASFLKQVFTFDWGNSWHTHENINQMILNGIGPSLSLTLPSFLISIFLCLLISLYTTYQRNQWQDRLITTFCLALMSLSFLVYIIFFQYFFSYRLSWFPVNGWDPTLTGRWQFLVLPWIISICVSLGPNILLYRSALIEEVNQDYVKTAKAKGLSAFLLYARHILKNAMVPILTLAFLQVPFLITGSLLLETFFSIPGLGGLLIQSIQNSDFPVIKAFTVIISIAYMFFNLLSDLVYYWLDPRMEFQ